LRHGIGEHQLLLVDTDVTFRDELSEALDRFRVPVLWRARVLGLAEALVEIDPAVVVLSADLPGGDPVSLLRSIRDRGAWDHMAVYIVGRDLPREMVLRAYAEGADAALGREGAVPEIAARVLGHLSRTRRWHRHDARHAADAALDLCERRIAVPAEPEERAPEPPANRVEPNPFAFSDGMPPAPKAPVLPRLPESIPIGVSAPASAPAPSSSDLMDLAPHPIRPATPVAVPDVIVVEDDPSLLEMLRYALTNRGYQTLSFANGLDALRALREMDTAGRQPVVLLDVDLPGIDGFRILHELSGSRPGVYQVILCTVHNSEATQVLGIQSGALDYLVKPLRMPIVLAKVERLIGRGSFNAAAHG